MLEIIVGIVGGLAVALVGAIIGAWVWEIKIRPRIANRAFRELFNFNPQYDVIFVFPTREQPPGRLHGEVAWEDMRAVEYVERALLNSGWPRDRIRFRGVKQPSRELRNCTPKDIDDLRTQFGGWPSDHVVSAGVKYPKSLDELTQEELAEFRQRFGQTEKEHNLVLICSPKSNKATQEALRELGFDWDMLPDRDTPLDSLVPWWRLRYFDGEFASPCFKGATPSGDLEDWAVIGKVNSPKTWNANAKLLFVFGIRAIGTWGAAKHFFEHASELHGRFGAGNFACRVPVAYGNWHIRPGAESVDHHEL